MGGVYNAAVLISPNSTKLARDIVRFHKTQKKPESFKFKLFRTTWDVVRSHLGGREGVIFLI